MASRAMAHVGGGAGGAGVDGDLVGDGAQPDAAFGEVVGEVEAFAHVAAEPVEGENVDPVPGVRGDAAQQVGEAFAVHGGAGAFVGPDEFVGDAGRFEGVDLAGEVLCGGADPGVAVVHRRGTVSLANAVARDVRPGFELNL
jgi:hypothetical protein